MLRKTALALSVTVLALIGLLVNAGAYLLEFESPADSSQVRGWDEPADPGAGGSVGVRRVGVDSGPVPMTIWYPAVPTPGGTAGQENPYAINILGPDTLTALASSRGTAQPGAVPDRGGAPYPLVVISHGFAIAPSSYGWLAEHLASQGLVVIAPDHREALDPSYLWESTYKRPMHIRSVLSYVDEETRDGGGLAGFVDAGVVAVVGHSYGGYTALAAGGARIDTEGFSASCTTVQGTGDPLEFLCDALLPRLGDVSSEAGLASMPPGLWPSWQEERVDAIVTIAGDAAMFGSEGLAAVKVPMMAIGGTADTDSPFEWGTRLTFDHVSSERKVEIALEGAGHLVFAGECGRARRILGLVSLGFCSDRAWDRTDAHEIVMASVTAFLRSELLGDEMAALALAPDEVSVDGVAYRAKGY